MEPFDEGYTAFYDDETPSANPYERFSKEDREWMSGYYSAQEEQDRIAYETMCFHLNTTTVE
jgi:hypothetical protein